MNLSLFRKRFAPKGCLRQRDPVTTGQRSLRRRASGSKAAPTGSSEVPEGIPLGESLGPSGQRTPRRDPLYVTPHDSSGQRQLNIYLPIYRHTFDVYLIYIINRNQVQHVVPACWFTPDRPGLSPLHIGREIAQSLRYIWPGIQQSTHRALRAIQGKTWAHEPFHIILCRA